MMDHDRGCASDPCDCSMVVIRPAMTLESGVVLWSVKPAPPATPVPAYVPASLWLRATAPGPVPFAGAIEGDRDRGHEHITHSHTVTTLGGSSMKTKPVAVLTIIYTVLLGLIGAAGFADLVGPKVLMVCTLVAVALGAVLGARTFNSVTPLAAPRDADGNRLVRISPRQRDTL